MAKLSINDLKDFRNQRALVRVDYNVPLDENGGIKTTAKVGGGNRMNVVGSVQEGAAEIMLDGYCKFEGPLTKK